MTTKDVEKCFYENWHYSEFSNKEQYSRIGQTNIEIRENNSGQKFDGFISVADNLRIFFNNKFCKNQLINDILSFYVFIYESFNENYKKLQSISFFEFKNLLKWDIVDRQRVLVVGDVEGRIQEFKEVCECKKYAGYINLSRYGTHRIVANNNISQVEYQIQKIFFRLLLTAIEIRKTITKKELM